MDFEAGLRGRVAGRGPMNSERAVHGRAVSSTRESDCPIRLRNPYEAFCGVGRPGIQLSARHGGQPTDAGLAFTIYLFHGDFYFNVTLCAFLCNW
jgi:hypothetical protein